MRQAAPTVVVAAASGYPVAEPVPLAPAVEHGVFADNPPLERPNIFVRHNAVDARVSDNL